MYHTSFRSNLRICRIIQTDGFWIDSRLRARKSGRYLSRDRWVFHGLYSNYMVVGTLQCKVAINAIKTKRKEPSRPMKLTALTVNSARQVEVPHRPAVLQIYYSLAT